ncbi:MAG TPA: lysylphosphatidylglycerol synthase transmembrane domain-containing protein [Gemmatimonadales bacterium]|nr:lysylphosphatidylglycerol synthase transmembrane domain-containing protein [Gemmatimonadales bacterium]
MSSAPSSTKSAISLSSPSNPSRQRWRWGGAWLIGLIISVALLVWVLHRINLPEVWHDAQQADGLLLVLTVTVATLTFPVRTIRWRLILRDAEGRPLPWMPLWHATTIGFMANNLLPARAGEVARAYVASRQLPVRFTTALASVGVERIFDALVMLGLMAVAIAAPSFPAHAAVGGRSLDGVATTTAVLFALVLLIALVVANRPGPFLSFVERVARRSLPFRLADRVVRASDGIVEGLIVLKNPKRFAGVVFWSLVLWIINAAAFAICFRAFGLAVPLEAALLLQAVIGFGIAVPASPSGVGVFEAATLLTLRLYGVEPNLAVSYALTYHLTTFLPITLLGLWSLSRLHIGLSELRASPRGETA